MIFEEPRWLLQGTPRPVQLEALARSFYGYSIRTGRKFDHHPKPAWGWGHFLEMRLGKTALAYNEYMLFKDECDFERLLIVSPNSFKQGWAAEAEKHGLDFEPYVFNSGKGTFKYMRATKPEAIIINYEALRSKEYHEWLAKKFINKKTLVVFDESVKLKTRTSLTARYGKLVVEKAGACRLLTGLPNPKSHADFYSQLRIAGFLKDVNFYAWRNRYCKVGGFRGRQIVGSMDTLQLKKRLTKMAFTASRREWTDDFKETDVEQVKIKMFPEQVAAYNEMRDLFMAWAGGTEITVEAVITKYMKMHQATSGFMIDEDRIPREIYPFDKLDKTVRIKEMLEESIPGKLFIVAHHTHVLYRLLDTLDKYNPMIIAGQATMKLLGQNAEQNKKLFNENPAVKVLIGQTQAVKYGHMLMGSQEHPCIDMVFFENTYNYDDRAQAIQRPQGQGQVANLHVVDFYSSELELKIMKNLQDKKAVADLIMGAVKEGGL